MNLRCYREGDESRELMMVPLSMFLLLLKIYTGKNIMRLLIVLRENLRGVSTKRAFVVRNIETMLISCANGNSYSFPDTFEEIYAKHVKAFIATSIAT